MGTSNATLSLRRFPGGKGIATGVMALGLALVASGCVNTGTTTSSEPFMRLEVNGAQSPTSLSTGMQLLLLLTVLSLAPSLLIMVTAFTRIAIVLSFVRNAVGIPQLPPNQVVVGLALFLTAFVMAPVWQRVNDTALQPYLKGTVAQEAAFEGGMGAVREFMLKQTREKDLSLFVSLARLPAPQGPSDVPTYVLIPAFIISELNTAFQMGFTILVPFLIIDMVVSSTLMSMGMMMLPPVVISLPFKVLLFVLVDGWYLITRSLVTSFY